MTRLSKGAKRSAQISRRVARSILKRGAKGAKALVLVMRNGEPSSVWGLEEYLKRKETVKKVRPWKHRRVKTTVPDPLGAVEGRILQPLTREYMYSEKEGGSG